jgi:rhodanese-related sulfurtransferase
MGPLVPDIIGNDLNFIVALFIGMCFGMILEQAGFSTSKKLVGLFYGYDFTVLRVFFTAGVVAMIGVIAFNHFGILDINLIYINPTFLWSAIVGGLIMGLGFVIGGFCPGTGVCAAAIGKIDGMLFMAGAFIGVLVFSEGYPVFEGLYKAENWGGVRIFETLKMSQSLFASLLVLMAMGAYWFVGIIEDKNNKIKSKKFNFTPYYIGLTVVGIIMAISPFLLPDRRETLLSEATEQSEASLNNINKITSDELAFRLMQNDDKLQIFDFRKNEEFAKFSLPTSTHFTFENFFDKDAIKLLQIKHRINVFISDDESESAKMAYVAKELGYDNIKILEGGLNGFKNEILNKETIESNKIKVNEATYSFRLRAFETIPVLVQQNKNAGGVKKTSKRALGGC